MFGIEYAFCRSQDRPVQPPQCRSPLRIWAAEISLAKPSAFGGEVMFTSCVVNTLPGAPRSSGLVASVPKQYRHDMHRNNASRSPMPATQKGKPCSLQALCQELHEWEGDIL